MPVICSDKVFRGFRFIAGHGRRCGAGSVKRRQQPQRIRLNPGHGLAACGNGETAVGQPRGRQPPRRCFPRTEAARRGSPTPHGRFDDVSLLLRRHSVGCLPVFCVTRPSVAIGKLSSTRGALPLKRDSQHATKACRGRSRRQLCRQDDKGVDRAWGLANWLHLTGGPAAYLSSSLLLDGHR